jgi:hypothetical protein
VTDLLFTIMPTFMVFHVALGAEALSTVLMRADEGSLVIVDPAVNVEVLLFAEGFFAAQECAFKGLCAEMHVHVGIEADSTAENLLASVMWADE